MSIFFLPQYNPSCLRTSRKCSLRHLQTLLRHHSTLAATTLTIPRPLTVLGIESSADDSCAAIVTSDRYILSNVVIKQHDQNADYGGIHPLKAQHAHQVGIPEVIRLALTKARITITQVDAIAYTRGPGMIGCLSVGASSAKALAAAHNIPLIGVHHMQAHALTPLLTESIPPEYPFFVLLVSGGHTQLVLAKSLDKFQILLDTLDNSIGNVFDKAARLLQLPPSLERGPGAVLEYYASLSYSQPNNQLDNSSKSHLNSSTDSIKTQKAFSFSGLLSATERLVNQLCPDGRVDEQVQKEISRAFQFATMGHLIDKVRLVMKDYPDVRGLVVSGGVACNQYLRRSADDSLEKMLRDIDSKAKLFYPPVELCTDNAAMIAWTAILRLQAGAKDEGFGLALRAKWSLEDLYDDLPQR
ncbi:hypothetical protein TREMEDRAFT_31504 [Tremella mesenterica DSM 1558]|uniref:uncharacterized protein n=1 Tax=Tremella mesenterica (strain ATCC 24925 / CBS 8224 / DSM 1558 / NBRC 9311 / NRRL Y-6157 / RJB 2259-6 / UBC 559-6) TaxID=578456 RepID=UPI0003F49F8C|nr:uncharacterized protein TREMEDRAFT_31504 [Tremella mesenterica DSM 1558]EIW68945.1 hypothetical protein TREMEDRAFT_31504 [Tremella mesenterica DSM 1558]